MLIEYKVSNFRSIYSEQSFNMMAIKSYKEKMDTNIVFQLYKKENYGINSNKFRQFRFCKTL